MEYVRRREKLKGGGALDDNGLVDGFIALDEVPRSYRFNFQA